MAGKAVVVSLMGGLGNQMFLCDRARRGAAQFRPYVLMVGLIDVRKNQISLLAIWSRLLREFKACRHATIALGNGM